MGDEILVTGEARYLQEKHGPGAPQVAVRGRDGSRRWSPLWAGNGRIAKPGAAQGPFLDLIHGPNCRPYIDYAQMESEFRTKYPNRPVVLKHAKDIPWRFTAARVRRGELPGIERLRPSGYAVIEPHYKAIVPNRDWGWANWQAVVETVEADWLQINPAGARVLNGARHIPANDFIEACRLLSGAALYVGPEGGLYHAAAALGIPAVAIFGGYVSPANQGYDEAAINLYEPMEGQSPCGMRLPCPHCREAMARIQPDTVARHVKALLSGSRPAESAAAAI